MIELLLGLGIIVGIFSVNLLVAVLISKITKDTISAWLIINITITFALFLLGVISWTLGTIILG